MRLLMTLASLVLSACASQDMAAPSAYSEADTQLAKAMATIATTHCIRGQYVSEQSAQMEGRVALSNVQVRRLHRGDRDWVKAEVVSSGTWDNVYYNPRTGGMVCGEKSWQSYANSSEIRFQEVGAQVKRLQP